MDEVALKRIRADNPTPTQVRVFREEIDLLRRLNHRNIVQFYGANLLPESFFLITELMSGARFGSGFVPFCGWMDGWVVG